MTSISPRRSIRRAVLVYKDAARPVRTLDGHEIVVGISRRIASRPIADLEIDNVDRGSIDEVMPVAGAGFEAGAHARLERGLAAIGDERRTAFEDVDELVLLGMCVPERRHRPRFQRGEIDAKDGQSEEIAQRAFDPSTDSARKNFGIDALAR